MFDTVVVASDLSPASERVIRCVTAWRGSGLRKVVIAHVHHIRHTGGDREALAADHEPKLELQAQTLRAAGVEAAWRLEFGVPYLEMNRIAAEEGAEAVVIGSHGKTWIEEVWLGSIGDAILRHSTVPVLVIKVNRLREMPLEECAAFCTALPSSLLLCTDFSEASERAAEVARRICRRTPCRVHVVHVCPLTGRLAHLPEALEQLKREDEAKLAQVVEQFRQAGAMAAEGTLRVDHPVSGILAAIEAHQPTLVVLGSRGRGWLPSLLLGSSCHEVARRSPVPVLAVPGGAPAPDSMPQEV